MNQKTRLNIYGRKHIHKHIRALVEWKSKKDPNHTLSEEYDSLLIAGIKAVYGQSVPLEIVPKDNTPMPAPEVQPHG